MEKNSLWDGGRESIDVWEYIRYVIRRWHYVAAAAAGCFFLAVIYVFFLATPVYEATAQMYVVNSSDSVLNLSDLQIGTYLTSDYQLVFNTWEVNQTVIENLKLPYSVRELKRMRTITNPSNTRALFITVQSPNPKEAADIANEYALVAKKYISETMRSDEPTIMSAALPGIDPVKPQKLLILSLAVISGAMLMVFALFAAYAMDDKIKNDQDVLKCTGAAPLGIIPTRERVGNRR